ncbi:hypothetical protein EUX98_g4943 [Antrodiella citrinella]|uniref:Ribosome recycling factor domain-containing protein n=1 Tax=Antrodiella citrinella TaxID=2447956 RepID=A0A4S4MTP1_9APHY|nr:hypothetical protein EUX98_g4943 [Antrodiella citrinella]
MSLSLLRNVVCRVPLTSSLRSPARAQDLAWRNIVLAPQTRSYASKKDNKKDQKRDKGSNNTNDDAEPSASASKQSLRNVQTDYLVPGSQRILAGEEYHKAEEKMQGVLDKYKKDLAELETRASGRVTPAVLAPVRVVLPHSEGKGVRLEEIATVGVREGTTLIITVFEESRVDSQTIKVPMPKPTVDARQALFTGAQRKAEECRTQIRKQQQLSIKKGAYAKRSQELDETQFKELLDKFIGEIDKLLASFKKITNPTK